MTYTASTEGPFFASGSISFSALRTNFARTSSGSVSLSNYYRITSTSNSDPRVPNSTENASIPTSGTLSLSNFRNTIKYYYRTQSGTDTNLTLHGNTLNWNSNLDKNIKKFIRLTGTCGSNSTSTPAATFNPGVACYNMTIQVSGNVWGCGGAKGTASTISGGSGGVALYVALSGGGTTVPINISSGARIRGGGGGGEKGAKGANGSSGTCTESITNRNCGSCPGCPSGWSSGTCNEGGGCGNKQECNWWGNCWRKTNKWNKTRRCTRTYTVSGGTGGAGGDGAPGRGYNYQTGSLTGQSGSAGTAGNGCGSTAGATGQKGGDGGDWGNAGGNTSNTGSGGSAGRAISGSSYSTTGANTTTVKGSY